MKLFTGRLKLFYQIISSLMVGNVHSWKGSTDGIPVYLGSIHEVSMWRYTDYGSTFGLINGRRGLVGGPVWIPDISSTSCQDVCVSYLSFKKKRLKLFYTMCKYVVFLFCLLKSLKMIY